MWSMGGSRRATWWCEATRVLWPPFLPQALQLTLLVAQGLLLDLDAATLTVWLNGGRKGVAVGPGPMANMLGRQHASGRLEGPLRWAVDLNIASVAIATRLFP